MLYSPSSRTARSPHLASGRRQQHEASRSLLHHPRPDTRARRRPTRRRPFPRSPRRATVARCDINACLSYVAITRCVINARPSSTNLVLCVLNAGMPTAPPSPNQAATSPWPTPPSCPRSEPRAWSSRTVRALWSPCRNTQVGCLRTCSILVWCPPGGREECEDVTAHPAGSTAASSASSPSAPLSCWRSSTTTTAARAGDLALVGGVAQRLAHVRRIHDTQTSAASHDTGGALALGGVKAATASCRPTLAPGGRAPIDVDPAVVAPCRSDHRDIGSDDSEVRWSRCYEVEGGVAHEKRGPTVVVLATAQLFEPCPAQAVARRRRDAARDQRQWQRLGFRPSLGEARASPRKK